jgi:hypothetical protein
MPGSGRQCSTGEAELWLFSGTSVSDPENDDDSDDAERFRATGLRWRRGGGMERATCTGKIALLMSYDDRIASSLARGRLDSVRLRTKCRSRFPVGSGPLLDLIREFPGWDPKLWLIANQRDVFHLLG